MFPKALFLTILLTALSPAGQSTGTAEESYRLTVVVTGVNSGQGTVRAVLCRQDEDFPNDCAIRSTAAAEPGVVQLTFDNVEGGTYAFAAFHDIDDDGRLGMASTGLPTEGLAFSKGAMGPSGPPTFARSAFEIGKDTRELVKMTYFSFGR